MKNKKLTMMETKKGAKREIEGWVVETWKKYYKKIWTDHRRVIKKKKYFYFLIFYNLYVYQLLSYYITSCSCLKHVRTTNVFSVTHNYTRIRLVVTLVFFYTLLFTLYIFWYLYPWSVDTFWFAILYQFTQRKIIF